MEKFIRLKKLKFGLFIFPFQLSLPPIDGRWSETVFNMMSRESVSGSYFIALQARGEY